jgi:hypothetical protein
VLVCWHSSHRPARSRPISSLRLVAIVGDQRFVLRKFQDEFIAQERREAGLDFLGLGFGSGEPEQGIIGVP